MRDSCRKLTDMTHGFWAHAISAEKRGVTFDTGTG
jgi:hypothetical protein